MTEERKEIITIKDMMDIFKCSYATACKKIRKIRNERLKVHFDNLGLR